MSRLILPGRTLELAYPTHNRFDLPLEFVRRTIDVTAVEDFSGRPIDLEWFLRRPMVRRGLLLVTGIDRQLGEQRRYWWEARRGQTLPSYRLGLYDPDQPGDSPDWLGRVFRPTVFDQLIMREAVQRFSASVAGQLDGLRLGIFPVEE